MKYFKKVVGTKCYLSPINLQDFEKYTEWVNDIEVSKHLSLLPLIINLESEKEALEKLAKSNSTFAIIDLQKDELIGNCGFIDINKIDRVAEFGIFIGNKDYWNKGYGEEATRLTLDYGFNILNLTNIMLKVFSYNKRGIKCYEKCGFKEFGKRRKAKLIGGTAYDVIHMDILNNEFSNSVLKKSFEE